MKKNLILIQKSSFVNTFIPSGAPKILIPFLIGIEIIYMLEDKNQMVMVVGYGMIMKIF